MQEAPRICVVIPVYNHGLTVGQVVQGARAFFPVIVVDDGSSDQTPAVLANQSSITVVAFPQNRGKGAALRAGFAKAETMGFTHAITIDADGQHATEALPGFESACRAHPDALIVGVRDLKHAGAPLARRASNSLSNFWFHFETGQRLGDTQCGYRCYPLAAVRGLRAGSGRYAFELEVMVKASWAGIPLLACPVVADYGAPTSRLSHFNPWRDMLHVSSLHSRLSMQAFCIPAPLRKLSALGSFQQLPWPKRIQTALRHLLAEHTETPGRLAGAVGVGAFCAVAPIWGFQMITAAALAHRLRLNKTVAVTASHLSAPPVTPFAIVGGLLLGHYLRTGRLLHWSLETAADQVSLYFAEWVLGSVVLALVVGMLAAGITWMLGHAWRRRGSAGHD